MECMILKITFSEMEILMILLVNVQKYHMNHLIPIVNNTLKYLNIYHKYLLIVELENIPFRYWPLVCVIMVKNKQCFFYMATVPIVKVC